MNKYTLLGVAILLHFGEIHGDVKNELNSFFESFGSSVNVNSADIYEGQKAGYCTAGGVTIRNRAMNSKIATVNLPKFDAGCGGIDMHMGGFSFIDSAQLKDTLKSIASSAVGYSFLLSMEIVSPQISNTARQLQSWANHMNGLSINSCEEATGLIGSVWPRNNAASQHVCRSNGTQSKLFGDYLTARHKCANSDSSLKSQNTGAKNAATLDEFNIAWLALNKHDFLAGNQSLAELFMSLTGTVVIADAKDQKKIEYYPSKMTNESFLNTLLEGGEATIYQCKERRQCLDLSTKTMSIPSSESLFGNVRATLLSIQNKILSDVELSQEEINFVRSCKLPIYRVINVMTAYKGGRSPVDLYQLSKIIAMDMLIQYLREVLVIAREGCMKTKISEAYSFNIDNYIAEINRLEEVIRRHEMNAKDQLEQEFHLLQKIQTIEEQIAAEIVL